MQSNIGKSPAPGSEKKRHLIRGWAFLWVAIGIMGVLAVGFFLTTTVLFKSAYTEPKQKEAEDILTALFESEMSYFAGHKCYSSDASVLGFNPDTLRRYEWAIVRADCTSFIARAWANFDDDPNLDIWEITDNDAFRPLHVFDDEKDIGYRIEPRSDVRWRPEDGYFQPPVSDREP